MHYNIMYQYVLKIIRDYCFYYFNYRYILTSFKKYSNVLSLLFLRHHQIRELQ